MSDSKFFTEDVEQRRVPEESYDRCLTEDLSCLLEFDDELLRDITSVDQPGMDVSHAGGVPSRVSGRPAKRGRPDRRRTGAARAAKRGSESSGRNRGRGWCFTVNLPDGHEFFPDSDARGNELHRVSKASYTIVGQETAPETGRRHYQGYLRTTQPVEFGTVVRALRQVYDTACPPHVEKAKGNAAANQTYCSKAGKYCELGEIPKQGNRSDLALICQQIQAGESLHDVASVDPVSYVRYHSGIKVCNYMIMV